MGRRSRLGISVSVPAAIASATASVNSENAKAAERGENPVVHREKLFGGVETAAEVHAKLAWAGAKCSACGGPPSIKIQVFVKLSDMSTETRMIVIGEIQAKRLRTVPLGNSMADAEPGVRTSLMYACSLCQREAEKAAAKAPSYAIVTIDRGPGADVPIVGVTATID